MKLIFAVLDVSLTVGLTRCYKTVFLHNNNKKKKKKKIYNYVRVINVLLVVIIIIWTH